MCLLHVTDLTVYLEHAGELTVRSMQMSIKPKFLDHKIHGSILNKHMHATTGTNKASPYAAVRTASDQRCLPKTVEFGVCY
jgi:hypothetical protein